MFQCSRCPHFHSFLRTLSHKQCPWREAGTGDSFDQYYASHIERPEVGKEISYQASGASDTRAVFSGHLFDPVEYHLFIIKSIDFWNTNGLNGIQFPLIMDLDSKNYKLQGEEFFEDRKSALEDLASKFNNIPRVVPFDLESNYGPKFSYTGPRFIEPSKEEDLLWYYFINYAINAKDIKAIQTYRQGEKRDEERKKKDRERIKGREGGGKKGGGGDGGEKKGGEKKGGDIQENEGNKKKFEERKREDEEKRREDEEKRRKKILERRRELHGVPHGGVRIPKLCALISGITTEFNPSGVWIVEDFFYDGEEVK